MLLEWTSRNSIDHIFKENIVKIFFFARWKNYRFVESGWCLEHISDFFQIPLFLKLALPDDGQLAHQIFDVSAEMLDGLQTIMEVPAKEEQIRLKCVFLKRKHARDLFRIL